MAAVAGLPARRPLPRGAAWNFVRYPGCRSRYKLLAVTIHRVVTVPINNIIETNPGCVRPTRREHQSVFARW